MLRNQSHHKVHLVAVTVLWFYEHFTSVLEVLMRKKKKILHSHFSADEGHPWLKAPVVSTALSEVKNEQNYVFIVPTLEE